MIGFESDAPGTLEHQNSINLGPVYSDGFHSHICAKTNSHPLYTLPGCIYSLLTIARSFLTTLKNGFINQSRFLNRARLMTRRV